VAAEVVEDGVRPWAALEFAGNRSDLVGLSANPAHARGPRTIAAQCCGMVRGPMILNGPSLSTMCGAMGCFDIEPDTPSGTHVMNEILLAQTTPSLPVPFSAYQQRAKPGASMVVISARQALHTTNSFQPVWRISDPYAI
jgi:hypothetical protein